MKKCGDESKILKRVKKFSEKVMKTFSTPVSRVLLSIFLTVILLFTVWLSDRLPFTLGGEGMTMKTVQIISLLSGNVNSGVPDGYLPVNICFDRQLADVEDEYGFPLGNTDITDREKLLRFLELVEGSDYKAIGIDISFDSEITTEWDSLLFAKINSMDRVAVAGDNGNGQSEIGIDDKKLVASSYNVNIYENGFAKYPFVSGREDSFALRLYKLAGETDIDFSSPLQQPHIFLNIRYPMQSRYSDENEKNYYHLGSDILDVYDRNSIDRLVKGKTIIIGDYEDMDMHDAYVGQVAGPVVILNAFEALRLDDTHIRFWSLFSMSVLFFGIVLFMAFGISLDSVTSRFSPILRFVINLIGISTVFLIFEYILALTTGEYHDMMWPVLILSGLSSFFGILNGKYPIDLMKISKTIKFKLSK